jgi:hypothetical protein
MAQLVTEWVNVTGDTWIIARESGEVWFHTPSSTKEDIDPFATPMTGTGSPGSTIGLLDGALNLGFSEIEKRLARPDPTIIGYIVALVGAYHTSVDTPRNLRRAASRFEELGRPEVAAYLARESLFNFGKTEIERAVEEPDRAAWRPRTRHRRRKWIYVLFRPARRVKPNLTRLASDNRSVARDVDPLREQLRHLKPPVLSVRPRWLLEGCDLACRRRNPAAQ